MQTAAVEDGQIFLLLEDHNFNDPQFLDMVSIAKLQSVLGLYIKVLKMSFTYNYYCKDTEPLYHSFMYSMDHFFLIFKKIVLVNVNINYVL